MNISKLSPGTSRKRGIDNGAKKMVKNIRLSREKKANKMMMMIRGIKEKT